MFMDSKVSDLSGLNITYSEGAYAMCQGATSLISFGNYRTSGGSIAMMFYNCSKLSKVGTLTVGTGTIYTRSFYNCSKLTDITFAGTIGQNLDIRYSPLNKASIESIIAHLSTTATGKTLTLKKTAVNSAFGIDVDDETTYPAGSEYYELRHSRDNWTFTYA
jgi:hypothetical protein